MTLGFDSESTIARCRTDAPSGRRIAVVSRKGGVGRTTATMLLGHTLAALRDDRVLAVDCDPDAGTLGDRIRRQTPATTLDVHNNLDRIDGYPAARRMTSQAPSRLEVLASPAEPHAARALSGADHHRVLDVMGAQYPIVICDTGTGILDDAMRGILVAVDQVVLISGAGLDTARAGSQTLDWLDDNGHDGLVRDAVVIINDVQDPSRPEIDRVASHFHNRTRAVHLTPHEVALEAGVIADVDQLTPLSRAAWLSAAASVADGFSRPSPRTGTAA